MSADLHVVFGAGQVGQPLAQHLLDAGKRVRIAKRSPVGSHVALTFFKATPLIRRSVRKPLRARRRCTTA